MISQPADPGESLERIHQHSSSCSGQTNIGAASFLGTTKQGDKLLGSFLSNYPDELKTSLAAVPGLKVTSVEKMTPNEFIKYEESRRNPSDRSSAPSLQKRKLARRRRPG